MSDYINLSEHLLGVIWREAARAFGAAAVVRKTLTVRESAGDCPAILMKPKNETTTSSPPPAHLERLPEVQAFRHVSKRFSLSRGQLEQIGDDGLSSLVEVRAAARDVALVENAYLLNGNASFDGLIAAAGPPTFDGTSQAEFVAACMSAKDALRDEAFEGPFSLLIDPATYAWLRLEYKWRRELVEEFGERIWRTTHLKPSGTTPPAALVVAADDGAHQLFLQPDFEIAVSRTFADADELKVELVAHEALAVHVLDGTQPGAPRGVVAIERLPPTKPAGSVGQAGKAARPRTAGARKPRGKG